MANGHWAFSRQRPVFSEPANKTSGGDGKGKKKFLFCNLSIQLGLDGRRERSLRVSGEIISPDQAIFKFENMGVFRLPDFGEREKGFLPVVESGLGMAKEGNFYVGSIMRLLINSVVTGAGDLSLWREMIAHAEKNGYKGKVPDLIAILKSDPDSFTLGYAT